ncbi:hypothetical protein HZC32_01150 [Candidatus Woesearchaeota archaeon]|nr:hypothetical protein [Candidatus Woesearchaeota archaeon]
MINDKTSIEQAVLYVSNGKEELKVSPRLELDQKEQQLHKIVKEIPDVNRAVELQDRLLEDMPYYHLYDDQQIKNYFSRWNLPIFSQEDLKLFSQVLSERILELAQSDAIAKNYLQEAEYREQLRKLPSVASQLEISLSGFDALIAPFETVCRYVYEAVTQQGFRMKEDGKNALENYEGIIDIFGSSSCSKIDSHLTIPQAELELKLVQNGRTYGKVDLYVGPKEELRQVNVTKKKKRLFFFESKSSFSKDEVALSPNLFLNGVFTSSNDDFKTSNFYCGSYDMVEFKKFFNYFKRGVSRNPDAGLPFLKYFFQIFFNLPKYMYNYQVRISKNIDSTLKEIVENIPKEEKEEKKLIAPK